ncbi:MAG: tRNA 2-thiouridine(34) synthase MnmA, partial [Candidatus Niyogibacteria bacterium]|nr:tRNA 2-thiouridine(34) synthase MnmA [Candidatus Niyogibacteria bacterium]
MNKSSNPPKARLGQRRRVFVAMSGGVDSSVAAALLKKSEQYDVVGVHMVCWRNSSGQSSALANSGCSAEQDAIDARLVAEKLNIPFYVFDFEKEYKEAVYDYMVREYAGGLTPNPDVMCN